MLRLVTNDVRYANIMCCPAVDVALRDLCVEREREREITRILNAIVNLLRPVPQTGVVVATHFSCERVGNSLPVK